ncbi:MAG: autotransporter domain-containing protein, partial [Alphaproteobacteria bacterium]|nr:autotransporter domain-containing protein [Alphaproteobacteria bacterium]
TKNIELNRGNISFGGFASYINTKISDTKSNGYSIGAFSNYKYNIFGAKALLDTGALNNRISGFKHDNSWFNIATSVYTDLKLDDTFYFEPSLYVGYMLVWSDELRVNSNKVTSRNYNFFNIAPELKFIKKISDNWFGALSGKYVAHFGGKNDIRVNGIRQSGLYLDDHSDIGIDVEYRLNNFIFGGKIHAMLGGIDGWNSNLNIKYMF